MSPARRVIAHPLDAPGLPIPVTETVEDGDVIEFGEAQVTVIHLHGHTPGSIALLYDAGPAGSHTCSPATRCFLAGRATRTATRATSRR